MRSTLSINPPAPQALLLGLVLVALVAIALVSGAVPAPELSGAAANLTDPNLAP